MIHPATTTIPFTGVTRTGSELSDFVLDNDFWNLSGAIELFKLGYNVDEINYMHACCFIEDAEDLLDYEMEYGPIEPVLVGLSDETAS